MHIPEGYLGPQTYTAAYAAAVPFWIAASKFVSKTLKKRQVPLMALGAAFSFVIMMFNVPMIGGTTGHAVGAVLVAVLIGPWAACIAVSVALIVQAVLFGDGGITAIGANCFNMAVVMPFCGYAAYKLVAGKSEMTAWRRACAAAVAGYIGINAAAIATAVMLGIQPMIALDEAGKPLYAPYPLKVALAAMVPEHLTLFGAVEAVVTGLVFRYLQKTDPGVLLAAAGRKKP